MNKENIDKEFIELKWEFLTRILCIKKFLIGMFLEKENEQVLLKMKVRTKISDRDKHIELIILTYWFFLVYLYKLYPK